MGQQREPYRDKAHEREVLDQEALLRALHTQVDLEGPGLSPAQWQRLYPTTPPPITSDQPEPIDLEGPGLPNMRRAYQAHYGTTAPPPRGVGPRTDIHLPSPSPREVLAQLLRKTR